MSFSWSRSVSFKLSSWSLSNIAWDSAHSIETSTSIRPIVNFIFLNFSAQILKSLEIETALLWSENVAFHVCQQINKYVYYSPYSVLLPRFHLSNQYTTSFSAQRWSWTDNFIDISIDLECDKFLMNVLQQLDEFLSEAAINEPVQSEFYKISWTFIKAIEAFSFHSF